MPDKTVKPTFQHFPYFRHAMTRRNYQMSQTAPASLTITQSAGGPAAIIRVIDGVPTETEISQEDWDSYKAPPDGVYDLEILGIRPPWEKPIDDPKYIKDGKLTRTMSALELQIVGGKGNGRVFYAQIPYSIHEKSHLGKVWAVTLGAFSQTMELTDLLGQQFRVYVQSRKALNKNNVEPVYANPEWGTAKPVGEETPDADWA